MGSNLRSAFPWILYFHKWHIYHDDPEDFDSAKMEFKNLLDDTDISESDPDYGERLVRQRKEIYQRSIREAGGALSFASTFFFDHVVNKALYSIPVVGTSMMVYDLAQLASELPDATRVFSQIILDEK